jgi:hypothetical protein
MAELDGVELVLGREILDAAPAVPAEDHHRRNVRLVERRLFAGDGALDERYGGSVSANPKKEN